MRLVKLAIMLCCVVLPATASAQVAFPADAAFSPLRCNRAPMARGTAACARPAVALQAE